VRPSLRSGAMTRIGPVPMPGTGPSDVRTARASRKAESSCEHGWDAGHSGCSGTQTLDKVLGDVGSVAEGGMRDGKWLRLRRLIPCYVGNLTVRAGRLV
jgi:hypothetical protein